MVVGAPGANAGAGRIYFVTELGLTQDLMNGLPESRLGTSMIAPGDLDGDGSPDLLLTMPGLDQPGGSAVGTWLRLSGVGGNNPNIPPVTDVTGVP